MGHVIEVFVTGCPLCHEAIEIVKKAMCPECILKVYNVLVNPRYMEKMRRYHVKALPTIIIDGKRRFEGVPELEEIKNALRTQ